MALSIHHRYCYYCRRCLLLLLLLSIETNFQIVNKHSIGLAHAESQAIKWTRTQSSLMTYSAYIDRREEKKTEPHTHTHQSMFFIFTCHWIAWMKTKCWFLYVIHQKTVWKFLFFYSSTSLSHLPVPMCSFTFSILLLILSVFIYACHFSTPFDKEKKNAAHTYTPIIIQESCFAYDFCRERETLSVENAIWHTIRIDRFSKFVHSEKCISKTPTFNTMDKLLAVADSENTLSCECDKVSRLKSLRKRQ